MKHILGLSLFFFLVWLFFCLFKDLVVQGTSRTSLWLFHPINGFNLFTIQLVTHYNQNEFKYQLYRILPTSPSPICRYVQFTQTPLIYSLIISSNQILHCAENLSSKLLEHLTLYYMTWPKFKHPGTCLQEDMWNRNYVCIVSGFCTVSSFLIKCESAPFTEEGV